MDAKQAQTVKTFDPYKDSYSDAVDAGVSFTRLSTDFKADYIGDVVYGHFGRKLNLQLSTYAVAWATIILCLKSKFRAIRRRRGRGAFSGLPFGGQYYVIATA